MKEIIENPLNLKSLNHFSLLCQSVEESVDFYTRILGFIPVKRPGYLDFSGAWLFSYGIGLHLLQLEDSDKIFKKTEINPKDNHISFQPIRSLVKVLPHRKGKSLPHVPGHDLVRLRNWCENMEVVEKKLKEMEIEYKRQRVEEGGIYVDQLFFHDPDGFMIEICNCDVLPVIPIVEDMVQPCSRIHAPRVTTNTESLFNCE
ncbi:hypothetical protein OSB04_030515 [Centaurea solstitialis]|uniref:VOC domain-containing protein n=1 Tax=Centaurea solstitialis TaxID=347529 RepID=A0AA38VWS0_9ASTR|nr:hypothetical protein OSB04_030515 [Centaurea solstitialis]